MSNNINNSVLTKPTVSPTKFLPSIAEAQEEKVFGRPTRPQDNIHDVMQYSHLNDLLRQKLRDTKINVKDRSSITKNIQMALQ
jgi:hypothetical protein